MSPIMEYFRAFRFPFESPNWIINLLLGVLWLFIVPVIGPIVWIGYEFEVIEALHCSRGRSSPDFDFNRFMPYLLRGVWAFLLNLIVFVPALVFLMAGYVALIAVIAAAASDNMNGLAATLVIVSIFVLFVAVFVLTSIAQRPLILWAGLAQEFNLGAAWAFMRDFCGRAFKELILTQLFITVFGTLFGLAGAAFFCVGMYPAYAAVVMADFHLTYQLYELYLERGGSAIPIKLEEVERYR
jgi:uncharacterized protein DUF4013